MFIHIWFYGKLKVFLNVSRRKTHEKKFVPVFRIEISQNLIMADLVLQIERVQTFFLQKYLILSHFLIPKTSTEDSILCHKRDFIHHFFTKGAFACLFIENFKTVAQWEIGWKKVKEVILPEFVFTFLIRQSISQLRKNHTMKPLATLHISGIRLQSENFRDNVHLFRIGNVNFRAKYLTICSNFVQHIYTHSKGF